MTDQDFQKLNDRVSLLEQQSLGVNPAIHPITQQNLKYQIGLVGGNSSTGQSHAPSTTTIPINQAGTPQLLDFSTNDFANGIIWDSPNHRFQAITGGVYFVSCTVNYLSANMQDGQAYSAIIKKGSTVISQSDVSAGGTSNPLGVTVSDLVNLAANDTISFYSQTSSNSAMTISGASGSITKQ